MVSINLPRFRCFEKDLGKVKAMLGKTMWALPPPEEQKLQANYERIVTSKDLNVEPMADLLTLKADYKSSPVCVGIVKKLEHAGPGRLPS